MNKIFPTLHFPATMTITLISLIISENLSLETQISSKKLAETKLSCYEGVLTNNTEIKKNLKMTQERIGHKLQSTMKVGIGCQ